MKAGSSPATPAPANDADVSNRSRAVAALCGVQILFGIHYSVAAEILETIPAGAWALVRCSVAAAVMAILIVATGRRWPTGLGNWGRIAGLSLLGVAVNQVLFVEGLSRSFALHSVLIMASIPLQTLVLSRVLGREPLSTRKLVSVLIGAVGILVLLRVDELGSTAPFVWANNRGSTDVAFHETVLWGDLLMLLNSLSFSLFLVLGESTARKIDPWTLTASTFACGTLAILPYGGPLLWEVDPALFTPRIGQLGAFAIGGATIGTYLLNFYAIRHVPASIVGLFIYLQFVVAAAVGVGWRGEPVEPRLVVASVLVLGGLTLRVVRRRPPRRSA